MDQTHRRLPHIYPEDRWLFVTWSLHGSLPQSHYPLPETMSAGRTFVWMDRLLDRARSGPLYLKEPAIAEVIVHSLFDGVRLCQYDLGPFVIMANHVHVLLLPLVLPSRLLNALKVSTAREANRILGRTAEPFWQRESYDHWVRDDWEWTRIAGCIEDDPVKAGFVRSAEEYRWSSAHELWRERVRTSVNAARLSACATAEMENAVHLESPVADREVFA